MTRTIEDCRERRGEPVQITIRGRVLLGTIEWGDDRRGYSVMTEPAGARHWVSKRELVPDPGGDRPLWVKRHGDSPPPQLSDK